MQLLIDNCVVRICMAKENGSSLESSQEFVSWHNHWLMSVLLQVASVVFKSYIYLGLI